MDFGTLGDNIPLIAAIVGLILLQFFFMRRRKPEATQPEIVQNLLAEVKLNQALAATVSLREKPKKFEAVSWQRGKGKLDFLGQPLEGTLSGAFMLIEDFNGQIEAARKYKSASYMANVNVDKLNALLAESKQGLEKWLLAKVGTKEPSTKYPTIFGDWLGRG